MLYTENPSTDPPLCRTVHEVWSKSYVITDSTNFHSCHELEKFLIDRLLE